VYHHLRHHETPGQSESRKCKETFSQAHLLLPPEEEPYCVKASGDGMRVFLTGCMIAAIVFGSMSPAAAGNKWMMEQNRDELLLLNAKLLEYLGNLEKDGEIVLKGSVVIRNGKTIIRIHQLQKYTSTPEKEDTLLEAAGMDVPYRVFLREMPLSEVRVIDDEKESSEEKKK